MIAHCRPEWRSCGAGFISYARQDLAAAQAFAAALAEAGHEVWWDREIQPGTRFSREIDAALNSSEAVVVLWSTASVDSAWVQDEASEGLADGRLVPTLIDECKPPLGFRQYQTIDMRLWGRGGGAFVPLLAAISSKLGVETKAGPRLAETQAKAIPPRVGVDLYHLSDRVRSQGPLTAVPLNTTRPARRWYQIVT